MADILKITTPLVNKAQTMESKRNVDLQTQFNLLEISKVVKANPQTELLKQNNGMIEREETSVLLMNMLKDPAMTVSLLKNVFALQELIKLLPVNNRPFTEEIEQLFELLMVKPDEIGGELLRQAGDSTSFRGELFDFLRDALSRYPEQKELRIAALRFLKALTLTTSQKEILSSIANSLQFLGQSVAPSKGLSEALLRLAAKYQSFGAPEHFTSLKKETLDLFVELQDSILFSPKLEKVISITLYNMSRFSDNPDHLRDATAGLMIQLHGDQSREGLTRLLRGYLDQIEEGGRERGRSVMNVLARILELQVQDEETMLLNSEKLEKIIYSLLSSPCNFTPLLHFVIPVQFENLRSFAEIWINPNGEEDDRSRAGENKEAVHLLLILDVDGIGHFELELFVAQSKVHFALFCPPAYVQAYQEMEWDLRGCVQGTSYQIGEVKIEKLERTRSLMDVFRSLPYKRAGVDVRI